MFKNKGFSLIELLLIVAITAGIFAFSAPFGMNFYRTKLLGDTQSNLIDALQRARHNAVLQKNDSNFGVKLSDINNNYVLFQTPDLTYSNRVQSQDEVFTVARGITLTTGLSDVIFSKMTGLPNATGTINIFYNSDLYRGILVDNNAVLSKIDATSSAPVVVGSNETTVPDAPTISTATAGNTTATVTFTAPAFSGGTAITGYTVTSNPAGGIDTNAGSTGLSHSITGLTNSTVYTFTVTATNNVGTSLASGSSNSVTPLPTDVYWVGGTGNWSDSANHWASTSGGTANANNLPGVTTNVTFDTNSGTGIVTVNGNASMATFTHSKASLTVAIGTYNLAVTGASSLTNGTTTIGISAGTGWTTGNLTVGANGTVAATGNAKVTISGNFDQSSITSKFLASTATITVNGNGTFTADGTVDSTQYNSASLVLNGVNTLTYNNLATGYTNGFNNLTVGQSGNTTTQNNRLAILGTVTIGSGTLAGTSDFLWLKGATPLSFDANSRISRDIVFYTGANKTIPTLTNGYDCNIRLNQSTVTQSGNITLNSNKYLYINYNNSSIWKTDGYNLVVGGNLTIGNGADTSLFKLDATHNGARTSTITVGGNWTNYGTGSAPSRFVADNSTVIFNSTATGKTITSGTTNSAFNNITFAGTGGGWTLQDPLVVNGNLSNTAGSVALGTNAVAVTGNVTISNAVADTFNMGSSIITIAGNFDWGASLGIWTKGTSAVVMTGTGKNLISPVSYNANRSWLNKITISDNASTTAPNRIYFSGLVTLNGAVTNGNQLYLGGGMTQGVSGTLTGGRVDFSSGTFTFANSVALKPGMFDVTAAAHLPPGIYSSTIYMDSPGTYVWSSGVYQFNAAVNIMPASGVATFDGTANPTLIFQAGLALSTTTGSITFINNSTNPNQLTGTANQTINLAGKNMGTWVVNKPTSGAVTWTSGDTITAGGAWSMVNLTVPAGVIIDTSATGNYGITLSGNFDQSSVTSKFLARSSTITVNGNGTFTANGTLDQTQYNSASLVLNGTNTLTYNNITAGYVNGFKNLTAGQGGLTTTIAGSDISVRTMLTIGSGILTGSKDIYANGTLVFDVDSQLTIPTLNLNGGNQQIPTLTKGYGCNIRAYNQNATATQVGDITLNAGKNFLVAGINGPLNVVTWKTDGYNLTVGGTVYIGAGADTGLKKLDATRNGARTSTITVGGSWLNYGTGTASSTFIADNSTVVFNSTATGKTITSGTTNSPFYNLTFNGTGGAWTLQDNLVVGGALTHTAGTLNAGGKNITTTGNLTISDGALVTASGLAGSTVTAGGNFSASGHAGALLTLNPASAWYLKVAGTAVANYVNVSYSNASGGTAITQTNSTNGGNNTNWGF
jgi:hypothetical protein